MSNTDQLKRKNSIEEKIETMLDQVMSEENTCISFCGDEESSPFGEVQAMNARKIQKKMNTVKEKMSFNNQRNREEQMSPGELYQRKGKKYATYTSKRNLAVPGFLDIYNENVLNALDLEREVPFAVPCYSQIPSLLCFPNNPVTLHHPLQQFQSQREIIPQNIPRVVNFTNQGLVQNNQYNIIQFQPAPLINVLQPIGKPPSFERFNFRPKTVNQNNIIHSYIKSNAFDQNNIQNVSQLNQKKFNTTILTNDQGAKLKNELFFHELESVMAKIERIDNNLYSRIKGNFSIILKSQKGSRIFQNSLKMTPNEIIHLIFLELYEELTQLLLDPYANYFCQKLFPYLCQKDRIIFLQSIEGMIADLAVNKIGTYPIQGIVEVVGSKTEKEIIINSIKDSLSSIAKDMYGTHVIEKIIGSFEEELTSFIFDFVLSNFISLANHCNSLCIIKKMLRLNLKKEVHEQIKSLLYENSLSLIQNPYGNYALQVAIEFWKEDEVEEIISQFSNKYSTLSMQKFSSNVVERCIEKSERSLSNYINELIMTNRLLDVMKNNYGNYVVQKALKLSSGDLKSVLCESICKNIHKLGDKKLITKWQSILLASTTDNFLTDPPSKWPSYDYS